MISRYEYDSMIVVLYGVVVFLGLGVVIYFFSSRFFSNISLVGTSWVSPYECGFSSRSLRFNCFSFTYFSLLVFFVVFDLEISLLLKMPEQGILFGKFIYYYIFLFILVVSFVLEVFVGYVRWGY